MAKIVKADEFNTLKANLAEELQRRGYEGSLYGLASTLQEATAGTAQTAAQADLVFKWGVSDWQQNMPSKVASGQYKNEADFNDVQTQINAHKAYSLDNDTTGCVGCSGLCKTSCANACSDGCSTNCSGTCHGNAKSSPGSNGDNTGINTGSTTSRDGSSP